MSILGLLCCSVAVAQSTPPRYNVVEFSAAAEREVANDLLTASLYVEDSNADPARLASAINRVLGDALKTAREYPAVKVRSGNQQTYPVYAPRGTQLQGWRGRAELRLETADFAAGSGLIGKLQATLQLQSFVLSVSPQARKATEDALIGEALAAFRARAELVQKALGGKAYKVQRIALGSGFQGSPAPRVMAMRSGVAEAGVAPPVEAGASVVSVSANGAVEIE